MIIILKTIMLLLASYHMIRSIIKANDKKYDEANYSLLWALVMIIQSYNL